MTHNCILREGLSPSRNLTSFSHRLSMRASCFSASKINSSDTMLFITLSTSVGMGMETHTHIHVNTPACVLFAVYCSEAEAQFYQFCLNRDCSACLTRLRWLGRLLTFIIVFETNITSLNDLSQVDVKSTFWVLLGDFRSFGLDVGSQLGSLWKCANIKSWYFVDLKNMSRLLSNLCRCSS